MRVVDSLAELPSRLATPFSLTIGTFDGLHIGHQQLLNILRQRSGNGTAAVLTFSNHPTSVLCPDRIPPMLYTVEHKERLLEASEIDLAMIIPFTRELAKQDPETFLCGVRRHLPFTHLILGYDASFGRNKSGTREAVARIAAQQGFSVEYVDAVEVEGTIVSSSKIRKAIAQGDLVQTSKWLGRPYSILGRVESGQGKGAHLGYPTMNINVEGLCTPPQGVYAVEAIIEGKYYPAIANLGTAPTLRGGVHPVLEVHVINVTLPHSPDLVETIFHRFLRPEQQFGSVGELQNQIARDIAGI